MLLLFVDVADVALAVVWCCCLVLSVGCRRWLLIVRVCCVSLGVAVCVVVCCSLCVLSCVVPCCMLLCVS